MALDWIKIQMSTPDKPEVMRMARKLNISRDDVLGKLFRLWAWFDSNSVDGVVDGVVSTDVDALVGLDGFASVMGDVGWLKWDDEAETITMPNFDKHNGESAKKRGLKAQRQAKWRQNKDADVDKPVDATVSTKASTREEKRREDNNSAKLDFSCWPQEPSEQVLNDWLKMRKRQKADVSQTVINRLAREFKKAAARGMTVDDCLSECVTRNWRGFELNWVLGGDESRASGGEVRAGL